MMGDENKVQEMLRKLVSEWPIPVPHGSISLGYCTFPLYLQYPQSILIYVPLPSISTNIFTFLK